MKLLKTLYALTALLLLGGCIKEDMSDCPPPFNAELTFSYKGDTNDPTMFGKMIDRVMLCVFDRSSGQFILTKTVEKADLKVFQGTQLYLPEGNYTLVSWGNTFDNTEILYNGSLGAGRVHAPAYGTTPQGKISTNDHLYYGELNLTVTVAATQPGSSAVMVTGDIPHQGAHINIEIYVKSFGQANDPTTYPVVEMANLMPQYNIQMEDAQPFATTYLPRVAWDAENKVMAARFQTLRFADDNPVLISIREPAPDNTVKATIDLKAFMADNNIQVDGKNEATVRVQVEFTDLGVSISIPDWGTSDTNPEI